MYLKKKQVEASYFLWSFPIIPSGMSTGKQGCGMAVVVYATTGKPRRTAPYSTLRVLAWRSPLEFQPYIYDYCAKYTPKDGFSSEGRKFNPSPTSTTKPPSPICSLDLLFPNERAIMHITLDRGRRCVNLLGHCRDSRGFKNDTKFFHKSLFIYTAYTILPHAFIFSKYVGAYICFAGGRGGVTKS